jgi:predicted nucleotide-binding protein
MKENEKLQQIIMEGEELVKARATYGKPEFSAWHTKTERFLTNKFGIGSVELRNFKHRLFGPAVFVSGVAHDDSIECVRDLETTILELKDYLSEEMEDDMNTEVKTNFVVPNRVFIVHGHDGELKEAIARLIENQGIEAIILSEQANRGKTIIEKFEKYSDVGAAIALFTNDDIGRAKNESDDKPRARQNVVFEAGYFMGKLGRDRIVIVAERGVEIPSDLKGVVYTSKSDWKTDVCRELKAMNYNIDFNKLF